jgi:hypothetical protein
MAAGSRESEIRSQAKLGLKWRIGMSIATVYRLNTVNANSEPYSVLQNVNCKKCQTRLGYRCDSAPEGHLLTKSDVPQNIAF